MFLLKSFKHSVITLSNKEKLILFDDETLKNRGNLLEREQQRIHKTGNIAVKPEDHEQGFSVKQIHESRFVYDLMKQCVIKYAAPGQCLHTNFPLHSANFILDSHCKAKAKTKDKKNCDHAFFMNVQFSRKHFIISHFETNEALDAKKILEKLDDYKYFYCIFQKNFIGEDGKELWEDEIKKKQKVRGPHGIRYLNSLGIRVREWVEDEMERKCIEFPRCKQSDFQEHEIFADYDKKIYEVIRKDIDEYYEMILQALKDDDSYSSCLDYVGEKTVILQRHDKVLFTCNKYQTVFFCGHPGHNLDTPKNMVNKLMRVRKKINVTITFISRELRISDSWVFTRLKNIVLSSPATEQPKAILMCLGKVVAMNRHKEFAQFFDQNLNVTKKYQLLLTMFDLQQGAMHMTFQNDAELHEAYNFQKTNPCNLKQSFGQEFLHCACEAIKKMVGEDYIEFQKKQHEILHNKDESKPEKKHRKIKVPLMFYVFLYEEKIVENALERLQIKKIDNVDDFYVMNERVSQQWLVSAQSDKTEKNTL